MRFGNDDWARLDPDWRRWLSLLCVAPERALDRHRTYYDRDETDRLLARSWAALDRLTDAQLDVVQHVLRTAVRVVIGTVHGHWRSQSLEPLRHFVNLRELDLARTHMLPSDLPFIAELTSLTKLSFEVYGDTMHDDHDLRPLAALTQLRSLQTTSMPLLGLDALGELTQLRELRLDHRGVFKHLAMAPSRLPLERLRKLEVLCVRGRLGQLAIHPRDVAQLGQLQRLELWDSPNAPIHEAAALAGLTQLRELCLSQTQLSTLGGLIDAPLQQLEHFVVPNLVPEGEVRSFSAAHPRCWVVRHGGKEGPGSCYQAGVHDEQ